MRVSQLNMIKYDRIPEGMEAMTKIRYKSAPSLSVLQPDGNDVKVKFYEHVKSIAPGQSAVFYEGDDVIGGGIIRQERLK